MNIDEDKKALLLDAVENDDFSNVQTLIKEGLDINLFLDNEENILHQCFLFKKYNLTQHLILHGINFLQQNNLGRTPLHLAARSGFYEGVHLLTLLTRNINQQDHKGRTALMHAIKFKQLILIKILMARGSDIDLQDSNGFASLLWAIKYLNPKELQEILSGELKDKLNQQVKEVMEDDTKELQVSDALIESVNYKEQNDNDENEYILPDYLRIAIGEKDTSEHVAPYSITEHKKMLKEQAQRDGLDYDEDPIDESIKRPELLIDPYDANEDIRPKAEEITIDMSMPGKDKAEEITIDMTMPLEEKRGECDYETPKEFIREKRGELEVELLEEDFQERPQTSREVIYNEEAFKKRHIDLKLERDEQEVRSPRTIVDDDNKIIKDRHKNIQGNEQTNMIGKGSVDHIKSYATNVEDSSPQEEIHTEIIKGTNASNDHSKEIQSIKRPDAISEELNENTVRKESDDAPIVIEKKVIKHLRDGYKEVYGKNVSDIRSIDKNIKTTELGKIERVNKNITDTTKTEVKDSGTVAEYLDNYSTKSSSSDNTLEETLVSGRTVDTSAEIQKIKSAKDVLSKTNTDNTAVSEQRRSFEVESGQKVSSQGTPIQDNDGIDIGASSKEINFSATEKEHKDEQEIETVDYRPEKKEKQEDIIIDIAKDNKKKTKENEDIDEDDQLDDIKDVNEKNGKGQSLVWLASYQGQTNMVKRLIQKGADYEVKDKEGLSAFMIAGIMGHTDIVEYFSEKVRNIDEKRKDGQTALSLAVENNQSEIIQLLVDKGAKIDMKLKGNNLLIHAAGVGAVNSIKTLIMLGLDPMAKNFKGKRALDIAKMNKKKKAYVLLQTIMKSRQG